MAKMRVHFELVVNSPVDGQAIVDSVAADFAGRAPFDWPVTLALVDEGSGRWIVTGHVRFIGDVDADEVFAIIQEKWQTGPLRTRIQIGSWVSKHRCPHDDPPSEWYNCRDSSSYIQAVK